MGLFTFMCCSLSCVIGRAVALMIVADPAHTGQPEEHGWAAPEVKHADNPLTIQDLNGSIPAMASATLSEVANHMQELDRFQDLMANTVNSALAREPGASPQQMASLVRSAFLQSSVATGITEGARGIASILHGQLKFPFDSCLIGCAVAAAGQASTSTFTSEAFAHVVFINFKLDRKEMRICYGQRGGLSLPKWGPGGVSTGLLVGAFQYEFTPGAALFCGGTLGPVTTLLSTKAGDPLALIGLVFVVGLPFFPEKETTVEDEDDSTPTGPTGNADYLIGYTWCHKINR